MKNRRKRGRRSGSPSENGGSEEEEEEKEEEEEEARVWKAEERRRRMKACGNRRSRERILKAISIDLWCHSCNQLMLFSTWNHVKQPCPPLHIVGQTKACQCDEQRPMHVNLKNTTQSNDEKYKRRCQRIHLCWNQQTRLSHVTTCHKRADWHCVNYSSFSLNTRHAQLLNYAVAQSRLSFVFRFVDLLLRGVENI